MSHIPSKELLEATHSFPCVFTYKVIGLTDSHFESELIKLFTAELSDPRGRHSKRLSKDSKHVAITLEIPVGSADHVIALYSELINLPGLALVL